MRLDKYLKVSRLIRRRTLANEVADAGRVMVNDKPAKASYAVKVGDVIEITFGNRPVKVRVLAAAPASRPGRPGANCKYTPQPQPGAERPQPFSAYRRYPHHQL